MILIRTNGGKNIGLGHIMRCYSLAEALKLKDPKEEIIFSVNREMVAFVEEKGYKADPFETFNKEDLEAIKNQKPDRIVFDSYLATNDYLKQLSQIATLIQFDDNNDLYNPVYAKLLINGNIHAPRLNYSKADNDTKLLLGLRYLIMRPEYWNVKPNRNGEGILITTGGSDFQQLMPRFIKALYNTNEEKNIIIGPAYPKEEIKTIKRLTNNNDTFRLIESPGSLKTHINTSKVIITAAGSTVYEVLRLNKIPIIYTFADNQKQIAQTLEEKGITNLGHLDEIDFTEDNIAEKCQKALVKEKTIKPLANLLDGKGYLRVLDQIETNYTEHLPLA